MQDIVDHTSAPMFSRYHLATRDVSDTTFIFIYFCCCCHTWHSYQSHFNILLGPIRWYDNATKTALPPKVSLLPSLFKSRRPSAEITSNVSRSTCNLPFNTASTRPVALCFLVKPGALLSAGLVPMHEGTETREEVNREITWERGRDVPRMDMRCSWLPRHGCEVLVTPPAWTKDFFFHVALRPHKPSG